MNQSIIKTSSALKSVVWGFVVGDALGVPFEFIERVSIKENPCTGITGYGTHGQAPGTWSDDTSMMLCVLENLLNGGNTQSLSELFIKWYKQGYMTANGEVFDIGITTRTALNNIINSGSYKHSGLKHQSSLGNGALMRCLPYALGSDFHKSSFQMVLDSRITHAHALSHHCCLFYVRMVRALLEGATKQEALASAVSYLRMGMRITDGEYSENMRCIRDFSRLMAPDFQCLAEQHIKSSGYVVHTLEAAVWCFLNSSSYAESVLRAVNLGGDTDTIAALTGGLSGLYYGFENIPDEWLHEIVNPLAINNVVNGYKMQPF